MVIKSYEENKSIKSNEAGQCESKCLSGKERVGGDLYSVDGPRFFQE